MIEEDELLRTQFEMQEGKLIARISSQADFKPGMDGVRPYRGKPWNTSSGHLILRRRRFRASMVKAEGNEPYIIIDMHHIISDGISSQIIFEPSS